VVVRARGPSLGVAGALANPQLTLVRNGVVEAINDDWQSDTNATQLAASGRAPGDMYEAAVLRTLAPGAYTAVVQGVGGTTGIALVEVYEMDEPDTPLIGISMRGPVQTGDKVMIAGFIIQGDGPRTVVVRARGPSLGVGGTLADPALTLMGSSGGIAFNDNWRSDPNATVLAQKGWQPSHDNEAAILITLPPGAYTAIVSGVADTSGIALVEVYRVD
jgi:hypothetical protein